MVVASLLRILLNVALVVEADGFDSLPGQLLQPPRWIVDKLNRAAV